MDKIIGFTISKTQIDHSDIDIFHRGIQYTKIENNGNFLYLWGIDEFEKCKIDTAYSLGFPHSDNLLDRNVLIEIKDDEIIVENDWLGSIPVFYNEKDGIVSTLSLKTLTNAEIHQEGLANFVECGFSVLGQTPFKDVKVLRYYSKLVFSPKGVFITEKEDPILGNDFRFPHSTEVEVFQKIRQYINDVETRTSNEIVIPTSGGYDSRLLNLCVRDKSRIRAFTYGISDNQSQSYEVVYAKKVAEILDITWEQVVLGKFHDFIDEWFKIYGITTHLHGMYHIEFYHIILQNHKLGTETTLLSGIFGDVWSGNVSIPDIKTSRDFPNLVYSHGMTADPTKMLNIPDFTSRKEFLSANRAILNENSGKIVFLIRNKLILISYLMVIPEYFGIPTWTPFLNFEIASSIMRIPEDRKNDRMWQRDLFKKHGLDIETRHLTVDSHNTLNRQAFEAHDFIPLDVNLLGKYFKIKYLMEINKFVLKLQKGTFIEMNPPLHMRNRYSRYLLRRFGIREKNPLSLLYAYYVLKPVEMGLIRGTRNST